MQLDISDGLEIEQQQQPQCSTNGKSTPGDIVTLPAAMHLILCCTN
jgi:hypothetical protein